MVVMSGGWAPVEESRMKGDFELLAPELQAADLHHRLLTHADWPQNKHARSKTVERSSDCLVRKTPPEAFLCAHTCSVRAGERGAS